MNTESSTPCINCDAAMTAAQKFCGQCGQRVIQGRLTLREVGHDLVHAITHADHSIFSLVKDLALRPGRVAREYVDGKRKKYFGPFAFLFILVGLASFVTLLAGVEWFAPVPDESPARRFLQRHFNLVVLVQAPMLAVVCQLMFRSRRLYFAEHLVLAAYTSGFRCLLLILVATPLLYALAGEGLHAGVIGGYFAVWLAYFCFAATQFYGGNRWLATCKALFAALLTQALSFFFVFIVIWLFELFGR
jgi:hypothetical protein